MTGSNRSLAGLDERATPFGAITDVSGVRIGHHQRIGRGWASGTTVVACPGGATPGVDVRGGAPGTRETDAIRPGRLVDTIHAVCLTGGSAYGLAAADGVMAELASRRLGVPVGVDPDHVVPVVPSAVIFDLGRGGRFENRPAATFGRRAAHGALGGRAAPPWGAVGAGTGARAGGIQGGVGTASTLVDLAAMPTAPGEPTPTGLVEVGAVVVVNSLGSVIDPSTGLPWEPSGARL
ncbi:MAG: P1 family peptidase, partial [Actinomycetota bacterium]